MPWPRFRKKKEIPSGLWVKCAECDATIFRKELLRNLNVCGECGHHFPVSARERVMMTADKDSFVEHSADLYAVDRLKFVDKEPYSEKLRKSIEKTGESDAAIYGSCTIEGHACVLCALDFTFIGGSMGTVVGERVTRAVELATQEEVPVIVVSASGGARMHEGALSLMQMAKSSAAIARHDQKKLLYVSVLTDPTTGGVTASFAALGDIILAEPKALIGFAGPRVIQETLKQQLPAGFQRAEFLLEKGFVDRIVPRAEMRMALAGFMSHLSRPTKHARLAPGAWHPPEPPAEPEAEPTENSATKS